MLSSNENLEILQTRIHHSFFKFTSSGPIHKVRTDLREGYLKMNIFGNFSIQNRGYGVKNKAYITYVLYGRAPLYTK